MNPRLMDTERFRLTSSPPLALYVHLPWCIRKCPYCDFNSHALQGRLAESTYVEALLADLDHSAAHIHGRRLETVFIGGGTPSLFSPRALDTLLQGIRTRLDLSEQAEITLEANPGTFEQVKFREFRALGINRLSIGVQSFDDRMLQALGRIHDGKGAQRALEMAHTAGFENINIDLMFALAGQSRSLCLADVATAIALQPSHVSFYQLTIEPNTRFHRHPPRLPSEEVIWEMQTKGAQLLAQHGYTQYEVSAFARAQRQCRHNLNYWRYGDYLGIGAGAHGKLTNLEYQSIQRQRRYRSPQRYMLMSGQDGGRREVQRLTPSDVVFEFMLNALRLWEGFDLKLFRARTGLSEALVAPELQKAAHEGLLTLEGQWVQPTAFGKRFLNDLSQRFLPA